MTAADSARDTTLLAVGNGRSVSQNVYDAILAQIQQLQVLPGQRLSEAELAKSLGVSRTPVREAFIRLSAEDLLEIQPQRGTVVAHVRTDKLREAEFVRESLEVAGLRRMQSLTKDHAAAIRGQLRAQKAAIASKDAHAFLVADDQVHQSLLAASGLENVWSVIQAAKLHLDRIRWLSLPDPRRLRVLLSEHTSVFEALENGDVDEAVAHLTAHLRTVLSTAQRLEIERPELFS